MIHYCSCHQGIWIIHYITLAVKILNGLHFIGGIHMHMLHCSTCYMLQACLLKECKPSGLDYRCACTRLCKSTAALYKCGNQVRYYFMYFGIIGIVIFLLPVGQGARDMHKENSCLRSRKVLFGPLIRALVAVCAICGGWLHLYCVCITCWM